MEKESFANNPCEEFFDSLAPHWDEHEKFDAGFAANSLHRAGIKQGDRVLDLACGSGVLTGLLSSITKEEVLGMDISSKMIEIARKKYEGHESFRFVRADFYRYKPEDKFDAIVVYNAYPHFVDAVAFSKKASECLKEGGRLLIFHSLSRQALAHHHEGLSSSISRDLLPPLEEVKTFASEFDCLIAEESDSHYLLCMRKK